MFLGLQGFRALGALLKVLGSRPLGLGLAPRDREALSGIDGLGFGGGPGASV